MKNIPHHFKIYFSHFRTKLLCAFLLCTLIPLCIIGAISYKVSHTIARDKILASTVSSDEQLNIQFQERFLQIENTADSLQYDMYNLMNTNVSKTDLQVLTETRNHLSLFKNTFNLHYIQVFLPKEHIGSEENLYFFPIEDLENFRIPKKSLENPGTSSIWFYQPDLSVPFLISESKEPTNTIALCRILKNPQTQVIEYAYILFLNTAEFSQPLLESFPHKSISSYLVTDTGEIIAGNNQNLSIALSSQDINFMKKHQNSTVKKGAVTCHISKLENGWYHITEIPDSYINQNIQILIKSILITLLISLPVTVLIIVLISRNLAEKIRVLSQAMEDFQLDTPTIALPWLTSPDRHPETFDEIDKLGLTFLKLQASLNQNLQSILDLSLAEERLKYQLLQSQINPHFLYNILGSIQTCQSLGKLDTASQMLTNLTRFYRMTLRKSGDLISIKDELEIARLYLEMEKLCHKNTLTWDISMEDGIENFLICKFTLQPFLENSIVHGFSQRTPHIHIRIELCYGEDTVQIRITDNGKGITEKQLCELKKTLKEKIINYEKHFGMGNVNKRICNPYFGNGHINIESRLYHGTCIFIEFDQLEDCNEKSYDC